MDPKTIAIFSERLLFFSKFSFLFFLKIYCSPNFQFRHNSYQAKIKLLEHVQGVCAPLQVVQFLLKCIPALFYLQYELNLRTHPLI